MQTGQFDKIMVYCQKANYTPDWGTLLTHIVRMNPAGALEFAQKLAAAEGVTLDYSTVADVFMQHNCLQQCTSFLLWFWLNFIVDLWFITDICVNMRTGYYKEGHFVSDDWLAAKNYVQGFSESF